MHSICFMMYDSGQNYIVLALYDLKEIFMQMDANLKDYYLLHSCSLKDLLVPFQSKNPLEATYESDGEKDPFRDLQTSVTSTLSND